MYKLFCDSCGRPMRRGTFFTVKVNGSIVTGRTRLPGFDRHYDICRKCFDKIFDDMKSNGEVG